MNIKLWEQKEYYSIYCDALETKWTETVEESYNLQQEIKSLKVAREHLVTATAYTASKDECDGQPHNTALMTRPTVGSTIAVSRDLSYLLGKKVYVEGHGVRRVEDLMNARFKNRIDVLVPDKAYARRFGVKHNIKVVPIS